MSLFSFFQNVVTPSAKVIEGAGRVAEQRIGRALERETQREVDRKVEQILSRIHRDPADEPPEDGSPDSPNRVHLFGGFFGR